MDYQAKQAARAVAAAAMQAGLRGSVTRVWEQMAARKTFEFQEGFAAYGEGIDGYAATPYTDGTQEMTDWFAGWVAAKTQDQSEAA